MIPILSDASNVANASRSTLHPHPQTTAPSYDSSGSAPPDPKFAHQLQIFRMLIKVKVRNRNRASQTASKEETDDEDLDHEDTCILPDAKDCLKKEQDNPSQSCFNSSKLSFASGHALVDSHAIRLRKDTEQLVVNFLGSHPPRRLRILLFCNACLLQTLA